MLAATVCCAALLSALTAESAAATPSQLVPYTSAANAADSMSRTVSGGFGTADQGGAYVTGPSAQFSVSGGAGHISAISPGNSVRATLTGIRGADEILKSAFTMPTLPTSGGGMYYRLELRRQTNGDQYSVRVRVAPGGVLTLSFTQVRNGVEAAIGAQAVLAQHATAGTSITLEAMVSGSTSTDLRARSWLTATAAPDWQLGVTDAAATRLSAAGQIGVSAYVSGTSQAMKLTVATVNGSAVTFQPGPANTGVPAGKTLTQYVGNMVVTTPGSTLDALDIHGFLTIQAANVTVKNSIIRGGVATGGNPGLVSNTSAAATNFVLQDSTIVPEHPSVALDGVRGANYTLTRVNIYGTVDGAKVIGNNVTIQNSWIHDTVHYLNDPYQSNGPSHNDGVQVLNGTKIRLLNNTITNSSNSALQVTQGNGVVSDLWFNGNWADGGGCTVNINNNPLAALAAIAVNDNRFGRASTFHCPVLVTKSTQLTALRNVYDDTGAAAVITYN
ncbi:MAG: hypothetical protein JWP07_830 [Pseudonocardiales bacterium]|nr:hypothetical protein [Pseudonocardiales bacterium]